MTIIEGDPKNPNVILRFIDDTKIIELSIFKNDNDLIKKTIYAIMKVYKNGYQEWTLRVRSNDDTQETILKYINIYKDKNMNIEVL